METVYTPHVARKPKPERGARPRQGEHMLALRQRAGLTQVELAAAAGVSQTSIGAWEWSAIPPRSRDLSKLAEALGVEVGDLVAPQGVEVGTPAKAKAPPVSELQKAFERVRALPRRQQKKIIEIVNAMVEQHGKRSA